MRPPHSCRFAALAIMLAALVPAAGSVLEQVGRTWTDKQRYLVEDDMYGEQWHCARGMTLLALVRSHEAHHRGAMTV